MGYSGAYGWQAAGKGLREIAQFLMANQQAKREREAAAAERAELQGAYSSLLPADDPRQEIAQRYGHLPGIGAQLTRPAAEDPDRATERELSKYQRQKEIDAAFAVPAKDPYGPDARGYYEFQKST